MDGTGGPTLVAIDRVGETVCITLSDGETMELAAGSLPPALPAPGETVPAAVLDDLRGADERKRVARDVFRYLDRRLRTRRDLERRLIERGYSEASVINVLDRFAETGVHSDRRFAEAWTRDTLRAKAVGRRWLVGKLAEKGVDRGIAAEVVDHELGPDRERALAEDAARAWRRRNRGEPDARLRSRGQRFLNGRGFAPQQARAAFDAVLAEEES